MTFTSRARRPAAAAWSEGLYWLDAIIAFVNLEKRLIIRLIAVQSKGNLISAFTIAIRAYLVVLAHSFFYQMIDRSMPGGISYLDFNTGAFGMWMIFSQMSHKGAPSLLQLPTNVPLRIRWINLFIADLIWVSTKIVVGVLACYLTFLLFPNPTITADGPRPDVPLLVALVVLAGLLGAGFGLMLQAVRVSIPALEALLEVFSWFMFISSGIYDTYSTLPAVVRPIFVLNPAMSVVEYARAALHPGYPVGDLTLAYPAGFAFCLLVLGFLINRRLNRVDVP